VFGRATIRLGIGPHFSWLKEMYLPTSGVSRLIELPYILSAKSRDICRQIMRKSAVWNMTLCSGATLLNFSALNYVIDGQ